MRYALQRSEHDCYIPIFDNTLTVNDSAELVVPDAREDVGEILDVRGQLTMETKKLSEGCAVISASVYATAFYLAEDGEKIEFVSTSIPLEYTINEPGIDEESAISVRLSLCSVEAKPLNPRKLIFRAQVSAAVKILIQDNFSLCTGPSPELEGKVHVLEKQASHSIITGVREKTFSVSDEYSLPKDISSDSSLITTQSEICVGEVKVVGTKLVFKASVSTTGFFMTDEGLKAGHFSSTFSQIIETDSECDPDSSTICLQLINADFTRLPDGSQAEYAAAYRMCATAVCAQELESSYIADAYSNVSELTVEHSGMELTALQPPQSIEIALEGRLPCDIQDVVYLCIVSACAGVTGDGRIKVSATATGIYMSDNKPRAIEIGFTGSAEPLTAENVKVLQLCISEAEISRDGTVSATAQISLETASKSEISAICALEIDEESGIDTSERPSVVVLCAQGESDLWTIAKKYGSTIEAIEAANGGEECVCAQMRPLLVPKAQ